MCMVKFEKKRFKIRFFLTFKRCNSRFSEKSSLKNDDFKFAAQLKITKCKTKVYIPEKLTNKISRSDVAVLLWKRQL